jgi:hypothetical protein
MDGRSCLVHLLDGGTGPGPGASAGGATHVGHSTGHTCTEGATVNVRKGNKGSYQSIVNAFNEYIRVGTDSDWTEL